MCSLLYNVHLCLCNLLIYRSKLVFANVQDGTNIIETGLSHSVSRFLQMRFWSIKTACKYENYGGFRDKMSRWYLQIIVRLRNG